MHVKTDGIHSQNDVLVLMKLIPTHTLILSHLLCVALSLFHLVRADSAVGNSLCDAFTQPILTIKRVSIELSLIRTLNE